MKHAPMLLLTCFIALSANAELVYRCGSTYSGSPCPQGTIIDAADPRSAAQRADAQRVAADDKHLASQMERERLAALAALPPIRVARLDAPRAALPASAPAPGHARHRAARPPATTDFTALDPTSVRHRSRP